MIDRICSCEKCGLCNNQRPLLEDGDERCQIIWVGLSAKKTKTIDEGPLSVETLSGKLIKEIEDCCGDVATYKTNLVKCLPLNESMKLRYPNRAEVDACIDNLVEEIHLYKPKIVFLLGERVYSSVGRHMDLDFEKWEDFDYKYVKNNGVYYIPVHHPSYISVYKRKQTKMYIDGILKMIEDIL